MGRRKRTETEKNNARQSNIADFSVDKEEQLKAFTEPKITTLTQDVIDMFDIKPVSSTGKFAGKSIQYFSERSYKESIEEAYRWQDKENSKVGEGIKKVVMKDYFPQPKGKKNILVSYDRV